MLLLSAIYVSAILPLAAVAAPLNYAVRGDATGFEELSRGDHDTSAVATHTGGDIFDELDVLARELDVELNPYSLGLERWESTSERKPASGRPSYTPNSQFKITSFVSTFV
ncbi:hypothetical protein FB451DRAFT_1185118 [Mycena latifolia]|nr:hypothetical protein FB451DRAFT_1185118 [Mycena latifolia]